MQFFYMSHNKTSHLHLLDLKKISSLDHFKLTLFRTSDSNFYFLKSRTSDLETGLVSDFRTIRIFWNTIIYSIFSNFFYKNHSLLLSTILNILLKYWDMYIFNRAYEIVKERIVGSLWIQKSQLITNYYFN